MKKSIFLLLIACTLTLSFSSCKKQYNCVCTDANGNIDETLMTVRTKSLAKETCDRLAVSGSTCQLK